ncbi:nucleoside-diphosphate sugar epimerase/dehydratase [Hydrogenovibrio sp. JE_KL2]|uniref:polysaccharide biosynthesis protein n=1 Tax=Hydrogenovibrio sp. JE_KL2 TaxID=2651188 RepID=UPI00128C3612
MKFKEALLSLSRFQKRLIFFVVDLFGLYAVAIVATWIRLGYIDASIEPFLPAIAILPFLAIPIFVTQGLYRAVIRYLGSKFATTVFYSVSFAFVLWATAIFMLQWPYPRSAILIAWLLTLLYISATRLFARWLLLEGLHKDLSILKSVVIFGAGTSGKQLASAIEKIPNMRVIGFIDDDETLYKHQIASITVYKRENLERLIEKHKVSEVLMALPSITASERKKILDWLEPFALKVSTLPSIDEIVSGKVSFSDVREVNIEDLLGRDPVPPRAELLSKCIEGQAVLVTGAGGSIGSELCRQVIKQNPKVLILYELSEFALYTIEHDLLKSGALSTTKMIPILGSVLDEFKLGRVIQKFEVDTVYHAAAYKHVPIVEHNIQEGIVNNAFGTHAAAKLAAENGVKNFVLISTDKAVRPTNVMGASKRLAEMVLQALQQEFTTTRFVMVRFGNVLGSSGSVIPLFRKQIIDGGPVTVTHPEITRYFMTIPEAASLVIQAGSMGGGGDVFVLDMGEPVKIDTLARKMIKLSGFEVVNYSGEGDIEIHYTGLRPGEKLYEELLIGDCVDGTDHPRIMTAHEDYVPYGQLLQLLKLIENDLKLYDYEIVLERLKTVVSGFEHPSGIVDYLAKSGMST